MCVKNVRVHLIKKHNASAVKNTEVLSRNQHTSAVVVQKKIEMRK